MSRCHVMFYERAESEQVRAGRAPSASRPRRGNRFLGKGLFAALGLASASLLAPMAHASPEYPNVVRDTLDLPCPPQCVLCHTSNPGRAGNVRQGFAATVGILRPDDPDTLRKLLRELEQAMPAPDTDGDGMPDVDELREGRDPNVSGEGDICALDVRYGCGARVEPQSPLSPTGTGAALLGLLGLGLWIRRRHAAG